MFLFESSCVFCLFCFVCFVGNVFFVTSLSKTLLFGLL